MVCKNAEYYGYVVGDKFRYRDDASEMDKTCYFRCSGGTMLTLLKDDDSDCPCFEDENGVKAYEELTLLVKIEEGPAEPCVEESLKPQDLGCWQQVVGVIGEERAAVELQKVIDIKDRKSVEFVADEELLEAFRWCNTPQGYNFWDDIDYGVDPKVNEDMNQNEEFVEAVSGIVVRQCDIPEGCTVSVEHEKVTISFDRKCYFVTSVEAYEKTIQTVRLLVEAKKV